MADITITAANVAPGANATIDRSGVAGAAITAGQAVYKEAATGAFKLSDNNSATAEARAAYGIALNSAGAGQPLAVQRDGDITIGGTLVGGSEYFLSANPGAICPVADLAAGMFPTALGIAKSATVLALNIKASGLSL